MPAKRSFERCSRCKAENPPEGFYSNGYCRPCGRAYYANWRKQHPERSIQNMRRYYQRNRDKVLLRAQAYAQGLKHQALEAYGGRCACCGESYPEFLAIDHIGGGRKGTIIGHKHRKSVCAGGGGNWYRWLRNQGWPNTFRVLCHNCNQSLGHFGYCPHSKQESMSRSA